MSFINSALIQKLTQQMDELTQRVVMLEGGKSDSKPTTKGSGLKPTGEPTEAIKEATNGVAKGSNKEPLEGV